MPVDPNEKTFPEFSPENHVISKQEATKLNGCYVVGNKIESIEPPAQHGKLVNLGTEGLDVICHPDCVEGVVYAIPKSYLGAYPLEEDEKRKLAVSKNLSIDGLPVPEPSNPVLICPTTEELLKPLTEETKVTFTTGGRDSNRPFEDVSCDSVEVKIRKVDRLYVTESKVEQPPPKSSLSSEHYKNGEYYFTKPQTPEVFPEMPTLTENEMHMITDLWPQINKLRADLIDKKVKQKNITESELEQLEYLQRLADIRIDLFAPLPKLGDIPTKAVATLQDLRNAIDGLSQPPTLEQAVAVLNERKHNYLEVRENEQILWRQGFDDNNKPLALLCTCDPTKPLSDKNKVTSIDILSEFEAIAVAEKYLREAK